MRLKALKKTKRKLIEVKQFINYIIKPMLLVMKLEITLLIRKWQMMNKIIWQSLLKNLKLKQNCK